MEIYRSKSEGGEFGLRLKLFSQYHLSTRKSLIEMNQFWSILITMYALGFLFALRDFEP